MKLANRVKNIITEEISTKELKDMTDGYLEAGLFSSHLDGEEEYNLDQYSIYDFSKEDRAKAEELCTKFYNEAEKELEKINVDLYELDMQEFGINFWYTTHGHGTGFWDGDYEKQVGDLLTELCKKYENVSSLGIYTDGEKPILENKELLDMKTVYSHFSKYFSSLDKSSSSSIMFHEVDLTNILKDYPDVNIDRLKVLATDAGLTCVTSKDQVGGRGTYIMFVSRDTILKTKKNESMKASLDKLLTKKKERKEPKLESRSSIRTTVLELLDGDDVSKFKTFEEFYDFIETTLHHESQDNDEKVEDYKEELKQIYSELIKQEVTEEEQLDFKIVTQEFTFTYPLDEFVKTVFKKELDFEVGDYYSGLSIKDIRDMDMYVKTIPENTNKVFPREVLIAQDNAEEMAFAKKYTDTVIAIVERTLENITNVTCEYLYYPEEGDFQQISTTASIKEATADLANNEITLKIENPHHLVNAIQEGMGYFYVSYGEGNVLSISSENSEEYNDTKRRLLNNLDDYFEVYGEGANWRDLERIDSSGLIDDDYFEETVKDYVSELSLEDVKDAVREAQEETDLTNEEILEVVTTLTKFTEEQINIASKESEETDESKQEEQFDKNKWSEFAKETLEGDEVKTELDTNEFGELMEKVYNASKEIESVLWAGANPSGTEDRVWVRVWAYLKGVKEYDKILSGLDSAHANRILGQMKAVGFRG